MEAEEEDEKEDMVLADEALLLQGKKVGNNELKKFVMASSMYRLACSSDTTAGEVFAEESHYFYPRLTGKPFEGYTREYRHDQHHFRATHTPNPEYFYRNNVTK